MFIILIFVFACYLSLNYSKFRGFMGEFWVRKELDKLPKDKYLILNDYMFEIDGKSHQIDHIVLSQYGIFVIEMKNYFGMIVGNEYNEKWRQYFGRKYFAFYNPIRQNYGHIQTLKELLNLDEKYFIPVICFSNQAKLRTKTKSIVTQLSFLNRVIKSFQDILYDEDLYSLRTKLVSLNIVDKAKRKKHVAAIREDVLKRKEQKDLMICPKCGGQLLKKNGRYGLFIGCSNFPKCRYTLKR